MYRGESQPSFECDSPSLKSEECTPSPKKAANYNVYDGAFPKMKFKLEKTELKKDMYSKAIMAAKGANVRTVDDQDYENLISSQLTL